MSQDIIIKREIYMAMQSCCFGGGGGGGGVRIVVFCPDDKNGIVFSLFFFLHTAFRMIKCCNLR